MGQKVLEYLNKQMKDNARSLDYAKKRGDLVAVANIEKKISYIEYLIDLVVKKEAIR